MICRVCYNAFVGNLKYIPILFVQSMEQNLKKYRAIFWFFKHF